MSGGRDCRTQTTNHRRYTNAATLMREMPTAELRAEDNQHNTESLTNNETISYLVITMEEEDDASWKREDIRNPECM